MSSPAAASPDLTAWDFLDVDWTVHALRLGQPRSAFRRAMGRRGVAWAERRKCGGNFRWRLSAESRYAETDLARTPQFEFRT